MQPHRTTQPQNETVEIANKDNFENENNLIASSPEYAQDRSAPQDLIRDPFPLEFDQRPVPRQSARLPSDFLVALIEDNESQVNNQDGIGQDFHNNHLESPEA